MNLAHLKLPETIARTGSLRAAAEEMGTSQPRLTLQLQKMERDLGATLFLRSPGGLKLSDAGRAFLPFARRIRSSFDSAQLAIAELGKGQEKRLRVGISITASMHLVPGNLLSFHKHHPDVSLSVTRGLPKQLLRGLEDDRFDLCIGVELPGSSLVNRQEVFSTRMAGFTAPSLNAKKALTLEQFCRFPLILPPRSCGTRTSLEDALKRSNIRPRVLMEVDDVSTIIALVKAGVAATILPRILPNVSRSIVLSEITDFVGEVKGVMLYPRNLKPEARAFMEIASERIHQQQKWNSAPIEARP
jgi:LysR family cyn operon transcriptional activator